MRLVKGGEDTFLELKVKLSNPVRIAQEIVALANTEGGVIVFGVNDQLRVEGVEDTEVVQDELARICREEIVPPLLPLIDRISFDNGRRIVALDIEPKRRPYRTRDGRFYLRIGAEKREATREEISALLDEARPLRYENVPAMGASMEDIDEAHLWSFVREFEGDAFDETSPLGYPTSDVLERDLLLASRMGDEVLPTIAGVLLFGRDLRVPEVLPRSTVIAKRFAGENTQAAEVEVVQLAGNLFTIYESALKFIRRYSDLWDERPKASTSESEPEMVARANYSRLVIEEAIANMLIHRDLVLRDHVTRINVFDRSIEFVNPRRTAGFAPVAQRAIRYGISQKLNPQLSSVFSSPGYGLTLPTGGLPELLRRSRQFSGRRPEIHSFNDEFRLRVFGA